MKGKTTDVGLLSMILAFYHFHITFTWPFSSVVPVLSPCQQMDSNGDLELVIESTDSDGKLMELAETLNKQLLTAAERLAKAVNGLEGTWPVDEDVTSSVIDEVPGIPSRSVHWPRSVYFTVNDDFADCPLLPPPTSSKLLTDSCKPQEL